MLGVKKDELASLVESEQGMTVPGNHLDQPIRDVAHGDYVVVTAI